MQVLFHTQTTPSEKWSIPVPDKLKVINVSVTQDLEGDVQQDPSTKVHAETIRTAPMLPYDTYVEQGTLYVTPVSGSQTVGRVVIQAVDRGTIISTTA